ncbi:membrane protein [Devosia epidermidihirudinis]|uniref:Membrane protein n=1 Tax=Devosia epidermidihirudinis TaxID=1293439 RepID=A0A0F5QDH6_9HYPH|nr:bile acid:sodium symporter family protein [Devosia epidermidihirudinis]KKC38773.1 membrane protein [Devosia epidermidihirudinis]
MKLLQKLRIDPYLLILMATMALAAVLPVSGEGAKVFGVVVNLAIALLFFLYGAKLSPRVVWEGISHWRLQGLVFASTYLIFPLLGLGVAFAARNVLAPELVTGLVFLSVLPSTVQSSIAFTSIAKGNVAAALTSASLSNLSGVFITPVLVGLLISQGNVGIDTSSIVSIGLQILLPFILGQIARPFIGNWLATRKKLTSLVDRGTIILVVYGAFSEGTVEGIWSAVSLDELAWMLVFCAVLLALIMGITAALGRLLKFDRADRIAILFCGSKKSLATGIPMAGILFAGPTVALIVLPLMLFHQLQLFVCAILAQRFGNNAPAELVEPELKPAQ